MFQTVFRSDEMPPAERLARFDDLQVHSDHPMHVRSDDPLNFHASARALDLAPLDAAELAPVNVVELTSSPSDVWRTPRLIQQCDPELYSVVFPLHGEVGLAQAGRETTLDTRHFTLYDSSQPFRMRVGAGSGETTLVRAHVPRALLPLPADKVRRLLAARLPREEGVGALLTQFLSGLTTHSGTYRPSDLPRLGSVAVDLLITALGHYLDAEDRVPDASAQNALLMRIDAFIQRQLHEPQLTPRLVAAAHHISLSHLHRLFQTREVTVAAYIRQQRLEGARRDLADPAMRDVSIQQIAIRWGFKDHATFTRAFRSAYDATPKDHRHRTLDMVAAGRLLRSVSDI